MPTFQSSDGLKLHFTDEGEGAPILCLAGLTRNMSDFDYVRPHFAGHRVICMDYRGRGKSDWAKDYTTYSIPQEAKDALDLLDHLGLEKAAILGTSRGGLIAMTLAVFAKDRLIGVTLNDIGPVIDPKGLDVIKGYLGRNPSWKTLDEAAVRRAEVMTSFANVPPSRWREDVAKFFNETPDGLRINYDPKLRDAVLEAGAQPVPDLWPLYDALGGLPLAIIRGANSDLLSLETYTEMLRRRPDAIGAQVPDRGHVPFLDEPEAHRALKLWMEKLA